MKTDRSSVLRFFLNGALWSFIGVCFTIAFFYWSGKRNSFRFTISLDDVQNLVEVRERIPDLKILYRSQDILELKRNIRIARITLRNEGATLLQQYYDVLEPFGLRFPAATILDYDMVDSNSDYLREHLLAAEEKLTVQDKQHEREIETEPNFIPLQKVIFEEGRYATLRVYLLQDQAEQRLTVEPVGKLANIDALRVTAPQSEKEGPRIPVFVLAFGSAYVGIIAAMFSLVGVITLIGKSSKKHKINHFVSKHSALSPVQSAIVSVYRNRWDPTLGRILRGCARGDRVFDLRKDLRDQIGAVTRKGTFLNLARMVLMPSFAIRLFHPRLLPRELFTCEGTEVTLNQENRDFILSFFASVGEIEEQQERHSGPTRARSEEDAKGEQPAGGDEEDREPQP